MAWPRRDHFPNHFVGDLVHTERGWVVVPPTACPAGHDYGGAHRARTAIRPGDTFVEIRRSAIISTATWGPIPRFEGLLTRLSL